jgi:3',5'-cyclic AMP phosphodiesterase CpdA
MFRIAHLTDPHVGPLPRPAIRHLLGKRFTGYVNWRRGRRAAHDMDVLAALVRDLREQAPDHIACTGDVCNLGLASEWPSSRLFLDGLGTPETVSFVPGNHDAYVQKSLAGLLKAVDPYARGDDARPPPRFPYLRRRGPVAIVGLSSAVPTAPFVASGKMGRAQRKHAQDMLSALADEPLFRLVLIHHPPHVGGAPAGRNLTDADKFEDIIRNAGADLVIHGHNHVGSVAHIEGPNGWIPVIGAPSASARGGALTHRAGYHVYTVSGEPGAFQVAAELRGLDPGGRFCGLGPLDLARNPVTFRQVMGMR